MSMDSDGNAASSPSTRVNRNVSGLIARAFMRTALERPVSAAAAVGRLEENLTMHFVEAPTTVFA